ncbi:MAG TPA: tetraacyldisaccharide 4'-kinase [Burkholderiaceae bacterium]|jgi:tetraacyldisaccharide 4'-kinase|nr:tetraacyldisaccharide 4'-kinase [Burkholderiaceae bacterium]
MLGRTLSRHLQRLWWQPRLAPLTALLLPLAWLVARIAARRRARSRAARATFPVPVIVVGNIIVGGAGKTPTVIAVVQALLQAGYRPGIVSRGHGRADAAPALLDASKPGPADPTAFGDEPVALHLRTGVPVCVARRRIEAARTLALAHPDVDVIVSDDGLQHAALPRDIELVVFDGRGIGNGHVLPAGPLREGIGDVWIPRMREERSRASGSTDTSTGARAASVYLDAGVARFGVLNGRWPEPPARALPPCVPRLVPATSRLVGVVELAAWAAGASPAPQALEKLHGRTLLAVAGIGAPERFFAMLEDAGVAIRRLPLPDHARFDPPPWDDAVQEVVVTEKDAVKLVRRPPGRTRIWVATLDLRLPDVLLANMRAALVAAAARRVADTSRSTS